MDNRAFAKRLMVHYFKTVWPGSVFTWNEDNQAELRVMVDAIIDAAVEETLKEVRDLLLEGAGKEND